MGRSRSSRWPPPRAAWRRSRRCFARCGGTSRRRRLVEAFAETWESETAACHFIESIHPEDRASAEARWEQAIDAKHVLDLTCRLRRGAKGSYRWTHVRALPLLDPDGAIRRWVGMNVRVSPGASSARPGEEAAEPASASIGRSIRFGPPYVPPSISDRSFFSIRCIRLRRPGEWLL